MNRKILVCLILLLSVVKVSGQTNALHIGLVKYSGGGDWYADPTAIPNLMKFCNENLNANFAKQALTVSLSSLDIFKCPILHITGHGNIIFSNEEVRNLRRYLKAGGFLYIDDNYGLDVYIRREMKKVFPDSEFRELSASHPIFHQNYDFPQGLPKIHEHDNKRPQAFGLFEDEKLVVLYTYESDLTDGWEDASVHNNPEDIRQKALEMGANIVSYVFTQ